MNRGSCAVLALAVFTLGANAEAAVVSAAPTGFKVTETAAIAAKPAEVWSALLTPGNWWLSAHSWSGNAKNMKLEPIAGGCWCETWPGGSARHLTVTYVATGTEIRFSGGLGPLQMQGVSGALVWSIDPDEHGTKVTWTYTVGGYSDPPLDALAPAVDGVLSEQLAALKKYAEGKR
jgi:uncharacterized protein YndB with AHSA1/START domain